MKKYLGDSVYAEWDEIACHIRLTTEDGALVTNVIYLDEYVIAKLNEFIKKINGEQVNENNKKTIRS